MLLVGESHYDSRPDGLGRNFTQQVVADYGVGDHPAATRLFKNAYAAFTGDFEFGIDGGKAEFWSSVCYCNYFQRVMWPSGEEPTTEDFKQSVEPFDAMLRAVQPDCFVVMSTRLWKGMKNPNKRLPAIGPLNLDDVFEFDIGQGHTAPAIHLSHPSPAAGGFDPRKWHPYIVEFVDHVRRV